MITGPLEAPSKCKSGLPRITRTCPGWWKQSFQLRLWSLVWFQVRATSCHLTSSKSAWKSTPSVPGCAKECGDPWCNQVTGGRPWVWQQDSAPVHKSKETRAWLQKEPAGSPPFNEYSPSSCWFLWKRHSPSSGSVSRRWLSLKTEATLNRCQLYDIIKLAELIFSINVLK